MHIRKIPATKAQQVINFFKAVYKEHSAEAIVLLFYNQETEQHEIIVPVQEVSGGAAEYDKGIIVEGYNMIGTIHSHASMSAFHSGVDDDDEKSFDGLHITFGNMKDDDISVSASIVANGYRVMVSPLEYINKMIMTVDIDEDEKLPIAQTWHWDKELHKMVMSKTNKFRTRRKFDQRYKIQLSKNPKFPPEWMEYVTKKIYKPIYNDSWYGYGQNNYEGNYWNNWQGHGVKDNNKSDVKTLSQITQKRLIGKMAPNKPMPSHDYKINTILENLDDTTKKIVLDWSIEKLEGKDYNTNSKERLYGTRLTHYQCALCQEYISVNEEIEGETVCCPLCETDEYLIEVTAREVMLAAEGVEFTDVDDDDVELIKCTSCGSTFDKKFLNDDKCPACANTINSAALMPDSMEDRMNNDSGMYLDLETDETNKTAVDEITHIPVPGIKSTPINKIDKPGIFTSIFQKPMEKGD